MTRAYLISVVGLVMVAAGLSACDGRESEGPTATAPALAEWQPETVVLLPELSKAEEEKIRVAQLEAVRPEEAAGLPIPPPVRHVEAGEELVARVECLREVGVDAELTPEGDGWGYEAEPGSEAEKFALRQDWLCLAKYPSPAKHHLPFTREQWQVLYEYWTGFFVPCVSVHGVEMSESPPSKDTWVDARMAGENGPESPAWDPREERYWSESSKQKFADDSSKLSELFKKCPGWPPSQYIYP